MRRATLLLACVTVLPAQPVPEAAFDAASIKPHPPPITMSVDPSVRGSLMVGTASTLRDMITVAYGVRYDQISGGPAWLASDRYDLEARADTGAALTRDRAQSMLRTLLAERFQLQVHRQTKEMPVYELVVAKNGPKFKPTAPDAKGGSFTRFLPTGMMHMEATRATMESLARQLSNTAGRTVIDKTALAGDYTFTLEWTAADRPADADANTASVFTAIQEQLGLKLNPAKDPIEMLIIDRAEKPSEN
jgi:uncharacterized protein (TIGR03435 family)